MLIHNSSTLRDFFCLAYTTYLFKFAVFVVIFDAPFIESGSIFFVIDVVVIIVAFVVVVEVGVDAAFLTNSPTPWLMSSLI